MRPQRVGVVVNPTAGAGRGAPAGPRVLGTLRAAGHDVLDLSAPTLEKAAASARAAVAGDHVDVLVVVGGDGMVHLGVNACAATSVPLGVVAVGSGNDTATTLGLPVHDVDAALAVIARSGERPRRIDAAYATPVGRWYVGVLSAGLDAAVSARASADTRSKGSMRYVRAVVGELRRFRPYGYRVVAGDRVWEQPGTLVAVANGPVVGGGVRIAPDAVLDDGQLDVVVARAFSRVRAATIFPGMYRGAHLRTQGIETFRSTAVVLEATAAGAAPPVACADGEVLGPLPLRVEVRPGALLVLAGP
ncbi:diacylglycerol kinase [Paraoerskovia marina]|uniref:Diacylglycerol kinase n=1 Tax=Paraoerskovia marina TaxID=545619 RepID=A0A1H1SW51_9CELL|nr:diacylglycerol kinase family protein [Paraoerskovia marina]SDS52174.1 diacylglycerol kinase [Paraoerskovia marina]